VLQITDLCPMCEHGDDVGQVHKLQQQHTFCYFL